ncbi:MAG: hypothetical protein H6Q69_2404 [Firmicutes bacterium]|nr:hypothetical protein [Bacillota bacterium]
MAEVALFSKVITMKLTEELLREVDTQAKVLGRDRSTFIRECIDAYFAERKGLSDLPEELVDQITFLVQIIITADNLEESKEIIVKEVLQLWKVLEQIQRLHRVNLPS